RSLCSANLHSQPRSYKPAPPATFSLSNHSFLISAIASRRTYTSSKKNRFHLPAHPTTMSNISASVKRRLPESDSPTAGNLSGDDLDDNYAPHSRNTSYKDLAAKDPPPAKPSSRSTDSLL